MRQIAEGTPAAEPPGPNQALARLIGADTVVPCADGRPRRYVNLDYAASTPVHGRRVGAVEAFMPWYSSVHRGSGAEVAASRPPRSRTRATTVAEFVGARDDDAVVFVRNTTEAHQRPARRRCRPGTRVLSSPVEHHSNMLPWRRHDLAAASVHRARQTSCWTRRERALARGRGSTSSPSRAPRTSPARSGRSPARRARATATARGCSSTRRSSRRTVPIDMARRGHRLPRPLRPQALRAVRRRRARRRRGAASATARRSCTAAGRSNSSRRDDVIWADAPDAPRGRLAERRRSGGARRRLPRPARARAWTTCRRARDGRCSAHLWSALPASRDCAGSRLWPDAGRSRRRRHLQPRRLPHTPCSRRSSATSTRSASATAASARTRSSRVCSASPDAELDRLARRAARRAASRRSPAPCGPASGSAPRRTTSTA